MKLTSVWEGSDWDLLPILIPFWMRRDPPYKIWDVTYGGGRFWKKWPVELGHIAGSDLVPQAPHVQQFNYLDMQIALDHGFSKTWDCIVWDPPHWADKKTEHASQQGVNLYGDGGKDPLDGAERFLGGCRELLVDSGIVVVKLSNQVHSARQQWQCDRVRAAAVAEGLCPCDEMVKIRPAPGPDNWDRQLHLRKRHSSFICLRNHDRC